MPKDLSVIVCTRNRSHHLMEALESLRNQSIRDRLDWEIMVVDNGSDDDTEAVVDRISKSTDIEIKYILETKIGLSNARNRGLYESKGIIIVFMDDDAIADERWLEEITATFNLADVISVGGKTIARWESSQKQVNEELFQFSIGYGPNQMDVRTMNGSNMSFKRDILMEAGGFDINLGRKDLCRLSGDDMDIFNSINNLRRYPKIIYNPKAVVYHKVLPCRLTKEELLRKHYCTGISDAMIDCKQSMSVYLYRLIRRMKNLSLSLVKLIFNRMAWKAATSSDFFYILQGHKGYFIQLIFGKSVACSKCQIYKSLR